MRYLIILSFSILNVEVFGQFAISYQHMVHPNDSISWSQLDTTNFSAGNSGSNTIWNFSSISIIQSNSSSIYYQPTSNAACFSNQPTNMYTNYYPPGSTYKKNYYQSDSTEFSYAGYCQNDPPYNSGSLVYVDRQANMLLPLNFLDSFTDTSFGTLQGGITISNWQVNGIISKTYDGYGELHLPWITYTNVARVQVTGYRKDSLLSSTMGSGAKRIDSWTGFEWYDYSSRGIVFGFIENTHTNIQVNGTQNVSTYKQVYAQENPLTGISQVGSPIHNIAFSPIPSAGFIHADLANFNMNNYPMSVIVYDIQGRILIEEQTQISSIQNGIDLTGLNNGAYIVRIITNREIFTGKALIQH